MNVNYFDRIRDFYSKHRRMPSNREIVSLCGFSSTVQAFRLTTKLIDERLIAKDKTGRLVPTERFLGGVKLLGIVEAGWPSPAEEELADVMRLEEWLVEKKEATYLMAEVAVSRQTFADILMLIARLRAPPAPA
jgi:SOS-response transcriptional repressor LexA